MAGSPCDSTSKIPILHSTQLKSRISKPLSSLSNRVRAHLDASRAQSSTSSIFLSFLHSTAGSNLKDANIATKPMVSSSLPSDQRKNDDYKSLSVDCNTVGNVTRLSRPTSFFTSGRFFPPADTAATNTVNASHIGKRVYLNSGKNGILRFVGTTNFGEGVWCGIELDTANGTTDGTVNNVRYFTCPPAKGVFALASKVCLADASSKGEIREYLSDVSDSGPHSLLGITSEIDLSSINDRINVENPTSAEKIHFPAAKNTHSQFSATPTPNSSNSSFIPSYEWKCNMQYSSSPGSMMSQLGLSAPVDAPSVQISKHSSIEYDESLGILTPDQMGELTTYSNDVTILSGDELSISPLRDADTVCLEIPDPLERLLYQTDTRNNSQRKDNILKTLSLEELPINRIDDISTTLIANQSDQAPTVLPSGFVTSVTSIGSWDNGYQGDGECSRPTSRGAVEASPSAQVPKMSATNLLDGLTDSDFYTESDYEDATSKCAQRDRKARIIDGRLFGSPVNAKLAASRPCNVQIFAAETNLTALEQRSSVPEEMDSSGIYSDLEKKLEEKRAEGWTPEGSHSDTSSKSISSQRLVQIGKSDHKNIKATNENKNNKDQPAKNEIKNTSHKDNAKKIENTSKRAAKCRDSSKCAEVQNVTKPKIPRQNASSKTKPSSFPSNKCCENDNQENCQPTTVATNVTAKIECRKNETNTAGCLDLVSMKTETHCNNAKTKADRLKEVKSKVASSTIPGVASKLRNDVKVFSPNANAMNKTTVVGKKQTRVLSDSSTKLSRDYRVKKSRKIQTQREMESRASSEMVFNSKSSASRSQTSSRNSSITDISDSHIDISQHSLPAVADPLKYTKSTKSSSLLCSPVSDSAVPIVRLNTDFMTANITKISPSSTLKTRSASKNISSIRPLIEDSSANTINTNIDAIPRKTTHHRALPKVSLRARHPAPIMNNTRHKNPSKPSSHSKNSASIDNRHSVDHKTRQLNEISNIHPLLVQLKHATDGMEAFIILFQNLTSDTDVFKLDRIKRELSKYKDDCLDMNRKLEEANLNYRRLEEEIKTERLFQEQKLEELRIIHLTQLDQLNENQKRELEEHSSVRELELKKFKDEFENKEHALHTKYNEVICLIQNRIEQKFKSILEETKTEVELLKIENEAWKDKLIKESRKKLKNVDTEFKNKAKVAETNSASRSNKVEQEEQKHEYVIESSTRLKQISEIEDKFRRKTSNLDCNESNNAETGIDAIDAHNVENEICSLRAVLELKHNEIQELRKQNEKLKKAAQDLPFVEQKLDLAQARIEDLSAQLQAKVENEKTLLKENRRLLEKLQHENEKKKRLIFQNEELWWKLKNSTQVAKTLAVYNINSKKDEIRIGSTLVHSTPFHQKMQLIEPSIDKKDLSSKVLGIVEKNDSVSWMLEIDESPIAVASRMLRHAHTLGVKRQSKMRQKLQQPLSAPSRCVGDSRTNAAENESTLKASSSNSKKAKLESNVENLELENVDVDRYENKLAIANMAKFLDFLQDSDLGEMELVARKNDPEVDNCISFYNESGSPFSNTSTTSSDSSLEFDHFNMAELKAYSFTIWDTLQEKAINDESHSGDIMADKLQNDGIELKKSK